ncbi:MAG: hypothetical protein JXR46_09835 [Calditrichaceae bacterium]|nr:hypothetical protein [Calditrichaceae bacterium]MBN2709334.1 hypothetical protein [Calditrichaceae bacterium]RQV94667.1 MAG: hypothetical protein EH224_09615 [Calditrichota bacterium]
MKLIISFLFFLLIFSSGLAQKANMVSRPLAKTVNLNELPDKLINGSEIITVSKSNKAIIRDKSGNSPGFQLIDMNTRQAISAINLDNPDIKSVNFSKDGRFLIIKKDTNSKEYIEVFDLENNELLRIENPEYDIAYFDLYDFNKYVYWVKPKTDRFKLYLTNKTSGIENVINGMKGQWAPNGRYFLIDAYDKEELILREKIEYKKISKEEYENEIKNGGTILEKIPWVYCIYSEEGKQLFKFDQFDDYLDWIKWSFDSKKIVARKRGDTGFHIIFLDIISDELKILNTIYFEGAMPDKNATYVCINPKWSNDSEKLLFKLNAERDENIVDQDLWILNLSDNTYYKIIDLNNANIKRFTWSGLDHVIVTYSEYGNSNEITLKLELQ